MSRNKEAISKISEAVYDAGMAKTVAEMTEGEKLILKDQTQTRVGDDGYHPVIEGFSPVFKHYNPQFDERDNPKLIQAEKDGKVQYEKIPWQILESDARVHAHGAAKYGERNWRLDKILASTYEGAIMRHFIAWATGEDIDPDSGEPHLNHVRACCAIVLDAGNHGTLIDDRFRAYSKDLANE